MKPLSVFLAIILSLSLCVCAFAADIPDKDAPSYDIVLKSVSKRRITLTLVFNNCVGLTEFYAEIYYDASMLSCQFSMKGEDATKLESLAQHNPMYDILVVERDKKDGCLSVWAGFGNKLYSTAEYKEAARGYGLSSYPNGEGFQAIDIIFEGSDFSISDISLSVKATAYGVENIEAREITVSLSDHEHVFSDGWRVVKESTCIEYGIEKAVCKKCGSEFTRYLPLTEHVYTKEFVVDRSPNCVFPGEQSKHCIYCDVRDNITSISPRHYFEDWKISDESTEDRVVIKSNCNGSRVILNGCPRYETKIFDIPGIVSEWETEQIKPSKRDVVVYGGMKVGYFLEFISEDARVVDMKGSEVAQDSLIASGMQVVLSYEGLDYARVSVIVPYDADGDGSISASDARLALRASVGLDELSRAQTLAADRDSSGKVEASDARAILRRSVGLV